MIEEYHTLVNRKDRLVGYVTGLLSGLGHPVLNDEIFNICLQELNEAINAIAEKHNKNITKGEPNHD